MFALKCKNKSGKRGQGEKKSRLRALASRAKKSVLNTPFLWENKLICIELLFNIIQIDIFFLQNYDF